MVPADEEDGLDLVAVTRGVGLELPAVLRELVRLTGVGEARATGRPGFVTSDVVAVGFGSGS